VIFGIPTPADPPTVVPAPTTTTKTATAAGAPGATSLTLNNTTDLSDGMSITDITATTVSYTTTARTNPNALAFSYATLAPTDPSTTPTTVTHVAGGFAPAGSSTLPMSSVTGVTVGMLVSDIRTGQTGAIALGTVVQSIAGLNITLSQNIVTSVIATDTIQFQSIPANVLMVSSTSNLAVGMGVVNLSNPASIASGTTIIAVSGNEFTLSANLVSLVNTGDAIQCGRLRLITF
jgi:hypothetical protein